MTEQARAVLDTALRLTVEERAELAAELLASLDGEPHEDIEAVWAAEIVGQVARSDGGTRRAGPRAASRAGLEDRNLAVE